MEQQTAPAPAVHTKQYVFVDEYNRHKRLKVMRACDGCRKRKIRCDGAVQNGPWPCGACLRLKLKCVPPTLDPDDELETPNSAIGPGQFAFQHSTVSSRPNGVAGRPQVAHDWSASTTAPTTVMPPASASIQPNINAAAYSSQYFQQSLYPRMDALGSYSEECFAPNATSQFHDPVPNFVHSPTEASNSSNSDPQEVDAAVRELQEHMGDLTVDHTSVAPYMANEKKTLAETPAVEEVEVLLPLSVNTDTTVRIPPEMMPTDERALDYFGYFFNYIHPYSPVLSRAAFYDQWRNSRHSISPLVLEGIFACVARYLEEPIEARRWLALASRHETSFEDVPRLSTIQAMILLCRARESLPRRGYYYRSWMAVKYMTTMAVDLGLDKHMEQHRSGEACPLSKPDCLVRSRIWHTIFSLEILIGAPQGRTDFSVELDSIGVEVPIPSPDVDAFDQVTSRRFTYMTQNFRNVKITNNLWQSIRKVKKDWALDPAFVRQNELLATWLKELPPDFQLHFPDDGGAPYLANDHFVAYVHIYHHLVIIMHHRPQLQVLLEKRDQSFKQQLEICLASAVYMCKIQEALIRDFGMHGLQFMQRGINFTIYCVLTCTMLHLAAITSPDPLQNSEARDFFTRHMRVLEHCVPGASPEMQAQIHALREAFSRDTSKVFELKPTLGLRSPSTENEATPPEFRSSPQTASIHAAPSWSHLQDGGSSRTLSPSSEYAPSYDGVTSHGITSQSPLGGYISSSYQLPAPTSFANQSINRAVTSTPQIGYALEPVSSNDGLPAPVWDPSGIFNHWATAFGGSQAPPPPPQSLQTASIIPDPRSMQQPRISAPMQQQPSPGSQNSGYSAQQVAAEDYVPTVTPVMWQDAFTNAFVSGHGQKRYREASVDHSAGYSHYSSSKRRG